MILGWIKQRQYASVFFGLLVAYSGTALALPAGAINPQLIETTESTPIEPLVDLHQRTSKPHNTDLSQLAQDPVWLGLLHANPKPLITDRDFYLSNRNFSALSELKATLSALSTDRTLQCRYPGRALWLAHQGLLKAQTEGCSEYQDYLKRAPIDSINYVFATEKVSSPASMMGHVFLGLSGADSTGVTRRHGVSFSTQISAFNLPKNAYQTIISGKPGSFSLGPYDEKLAHYLDMEQRSVWVYELSTTAFGRELLSAHLWELKQTQLKYFFTTYNCATNLYFLLKVAGLTELSTHKRLLSPVDLTNLLSESPHVTSRSFIPSDQYGTTMLLGDPEATEFAHDLPSGHMLSQTQIEFSADPKTGFKQQQLLSYYAGLLKDRAEITAEELSNIQSQANPYTDLRLDLSEYKDPGKNPYTSEASAGVMHSQNQEWLSLSYSPVKRSLLDDNRQGLSQSELIMGETAIKLSTSNLKLERFTLYRAAAFQDANRFTQLRSGRINLAFEANPLVSNQPKLNLQVATGFTKTTGPSGVYGLAGYDNVGLDAHLLTGTLGAFAQRGGIRVSAELLSGVELSDQDWRLAGSLGISARQTPNQALELKLRSFARTQEKAPDPEASLGWVQKF